MPVLLILFAAVLLWLLTRFILKNNEKSAFIISLLLVLSFSYGHIYLLVDDFTLGNSDIGRHQYLLIPFVVTFIFGVYYFVKTKRRLNNATTISNASGFTITKVDDNSFTFETTDDVGTTPVILASSSVYWNNILNSKKKCKWLQNWKKFYNKLSKNTTFE